MTYKGHLSETFIVLDPDKSAVLVRNEPGVFETLGNRFGSFEGYELITILEFQSSWPNWEVHPKGDETVVLLSGEITFSLEKKGEVECCHMKEPGEFMVIPKGIWHTADVESSSKALFITPGEGTKHRLRS